MAKIRMKTTLGSTTEQVFSSFLAAAAARGVKEKTLDTYKQHFRSISKRLNTSLPIKELSKEDLDNMIFQMRSEQLSERSINSYTRTLKVFLSWCNEEGYTTLNIKLYKASEVFLTAGGCIFLPQRQLVFISDLTCGMITPMNEHKRRG